VVVRRGVEGVQGVAGVGQGGNRDPGVIHACLRKAGTVRIVGPEGACRATETAVHWAELSRLTALETLLAYMRVEPGAINGLSGPHVIVEGANLHVRSGAGTTVDTAGLGNVVVGYNEGRGGTDTSNRTGSHNLITGPEHQYTASGGLVAGSRNTVTANHGSVSGGDLNSASGLGSSVSGGLGNVASGETASVSGGQFNAASNF